MSVVQGLRCSCSSSAAWLPPNDQAIRSDAKATCTRPPAVAFGWRRRRVRESLIVSGPGEPGTPTPSSAAERDGNEAVWNQATVEGEAHQSQAARPRGRVPGTKDLDAAAAGEMGDGHRRRPVCLTKGELDVE